MRGENAQTVYRTERRGGFAQIPNAALRDDRLSWRARGLLAYMLSFPDDWAHRADDLQHVGPEGREAVRKAIRELEVVGYRTRERRRDEFGKIRTFVVLRDFVTTDDRKPVSRSSGQSVDAASLEDGHEHCHEETPTDPSDPHVEQQSLVDVPRVEKPKSLRVQISDALCDVFSVETVSARKLCGVVASELVKLDPVPSVEDVRARARWIVEGSGFDNPTPKALATHWKRAGDQVRRAGGDDLPVDPQSGMDPRRRAR